MINLELGLGSAAGRGEEEEEYVAAYEKEKLGAGLHPAAAPHLHLHFLDILGSSHNSSSTSSNVFLNQQLGSPLPPGWEQCLDLKSGVLFYKNLSNGSTTHMDPRVGLATNTSMDHASSHLTVLRTRTLIQTNIKAAGTPINDYVSDYTESVNGSAIRQGKAHFHEELLTPDVDLDLRLSSSLHVKSNLSAQPSSSNDSYVLMNSNSSMSCISDAIQGPANYYGSTPHLIPMLPSSVLVSSSSSPSAIPTWPSSGYVSSSSSPSATSYRHQCHDSDDEDTTNDGDQKDTSTKMTTAACMRCFMFVILNSTKEPMRCPMCGSHANPLHNL